MLRITSSQIENSWLPNWTVLRTARRPVEPEGHAA